MLGEMVFVRTGQWGQQLAHPNLELGTLLLAFARGKLLTDQLKLVITKPSPLGQLALSIMVLKGGKTYGSESTWSTVTWTGSGYGPLTGRSQSGIGYGYVLGSESTAPPSLSYGTDLGQRVYLILIPNEGFDKELNTSVVSA